MVRTWRDYNFPLFLCVVILLIFGAAMVYSATLRDPLTQGYFSRHLVNLLVGCAAMAVMTVIDYHFFEAWIVPFYLGAVALLGLVLAIGQVSSGAQSWIDLGVRTFQPSEPVKLLVILALAAYWSRNERQPSAWRVFITSLILVGIPTVLVFLQPDFGTAMVFGAIWLAMALAAGVRWQQFVVLFVAALPAAMYGWTHILRPYQRDRLLIFIDPLKYDPELKQGGWNIMQSLTAIGSGGLTGRGWTHGLLSQGNYLPVQYSDFIFAITGEELGFIGATLLLVFLGVTVWQALTVAQAARDSFGRLIATGIAAMLLCHVLVNVGMNMSIMPITGIPLPFISYGGSFTLTTLAAVGLLQSIALRRRRITF
ncbi:MAG: rod shape-determining protein RodA [Roseiflexus castenholzii]|uniref:rod shape-determining protein RodA n=1 Tax=Roseiflexus castenholzii TaxID=120962 RepID=UPI000CB99477|nr:MAG: rod shape-determining protein RodA [Roseiflexus castenholzii]